jgi:cell division septation protein DedD
VKAFLAACVGAIVLAAIGVIVLNRVQEPVDRAFAPSPYTRVGD